MYKRISALIMSIVFTAILTVNTFAYSNMYSSNSNIPDFSEVTGATMTSKEYALGGTLYLYDIPITDTASGDFRCVNWLYEYASILNENGYKVYKSTFFNTDDSINIYFYNPNKGLFVQLFCAKYGCIVLISNNSL